MVKSIVASVFAFGLLSSVAAKDVYYVSGYWGTPSDGATMVVKDGAGTTVKLPIADTDTLVVREGTAAGPTYGTEATSAYVSDETYYVPKHIRIECDFTFNAGVKTQLFAESTIEIASGKVLVIQSTKWNTAYVGTVTFAGAGTADLSGASTVASPIKVSASVNLNLPEGYAGEIAVTDPANLDMAKYPGYEKWIGEDGVAHLIKAGNIVAYVDDRPFASLSEAFDAAKPAGTIRSVANPWPTIGLPADLTDAEKWQGTVQFTGTLPNGFVPANYGNADSTIEFKGVSGGYLVNKGSFDGALKVTDVDASTPGWQINSGYSDDNFVFGALTGEGTIVDANSGVKQQYSFKDASKFAGSIKNAEAANGKRFVIGKSVHGSSTSQTGRIVVEEGYTVRVAPGKVLSGRWGMLVYGTVKGSGTLACTGSKMVYFGCGPSGEPSGDQATIDLSEGALTVAAGCGVTFGTTLTLKNAEEGAVVLNCSSEPTNLETVQLKDADGTVMPLARLAYADGQVTVTGMSKKVSGAEVWTVTAAEFAQVPNGFSLDLSEYLALDLAPVVLPEGTTADQATAFLAKLSVTVPSIRTNAKLTVKDNELVLASEPMTLYWAAWRGTFWEHIGQTDVNGNHGLMRDADGNLNVAHRPNDTVVFDKAHYQKDGVFAEQTDYWHYDENLYIKDEVQPGTSNDWDLKILEGVTLKMGLRGAKATGQNVISDLKIYVEEGSSLELGYWGNTHHYQGVIRDDVVFGGAGTITFGADLGASLRAEGDVLVKGGETPTMDLNGKELVLSGANASIEVNLTGFGAVTPTAAGIHLKGDVDFGNAATIDASTEANRVTLDKSATFGANLTVKLTHAPTEGNPVKILALGAGATASFTDTAVRVLVGGQPVAAFYELFTDGDGVLAVRVKERQVAYGTATGAGYDFAGALVTVTMDPAIEDLPIAVTVGDRVWTGTMGADGTGVVMVGDEDTLLPSGTYAYTVTVGANAYTGNGTLFIGDTWFKADPSSGASEEIGGAWQTAAPAIVAGKYCLTDTATFMVSADKAADARGVIEQMLSFDGPMADADLAALDMTDAKGALTLAEDASGALCWKGYVGGVWIKLTTTVPAELGEHRVRIEYDRTTANGTLQYFIDGVAASEPFAAAGAMTSVSYVGAGTLSELEGFVEDSALVAYAGVKYKSMEDAVTAWKAADKAGAITLLTNIYFAPEPDTYYIEKNDYSLYFTNDMVIQSETKNGDISTIVVGWPVAVVGYHAGSEDFPIVIDGEWLGHTIPWKRHSLIQQELLKTPVDSDFALWQAYALGFTPEEVSTAKAIARFATEGSTVYITDALPVRDADETGIVVTRLLMEGDASGTVKVLDEQPEATERGLPIDVTTGGRVRCFKLGYEFEADVGER